MKLHITLKLCIVLFIAVISPLKNYAYVGITHETINEHIAENTINDFSLNQYLIDYLGYQKGIKEDLFNKEIPEWLGLGGRAEDIFPRYLGHFHDPLDNAGLWHTFDSLISSLHKPNRDGGHYSWPEVRAYYYSSLTFKNAVYREENFTYTLRGLGQLMHLIEDSSVPLHTRNDGHPFGHTYEKYLEQKNDIVISLLAGSPYTLNKELIKQGIDTLVDTDQYIVGSTPDVTASSLIGLSEYSNANFLSIGTFPGTINDGDYPYPEISEFVEKRTVMINDPNTPNGVIARVYYLNSIGSDKYEVGAVSLVNVLNYDGVETIKVNLLDDTVYDNYADRLLPRAASYAAGLLEYFFRGTLEILPPDDGVYALVDGSVAPQQFNLIKAKVVNTTTDDEMQTGEIIAVAKYKKRTDYQPDLSTDPPTETSMEETFSYSVSNPVAIESLSSTDPQEFVFDFTDSPIPAGSTDLYLQVVFKGTLGNEEGTAIAVGMKDLSEPMHISLWNNTDRFYLDGVLRTGEDIRNNPDLLDRVDINKNGIVNEPTESYIDPYNVNTSVGFYPEGATLEYYAATWNALPPGRHGRLIILPGTSSFYIRVHRSASVPDISREADMLLSGVVNQMGESGNFQNAEVSTFRGFLQHQWTAYAEYLPTLDGIGNAPWDTSDMDPVPVTAIAQ